MHEFVIVDGIIRSVLASVSRDSKVHEITVEMGELLGLSDESVHLAFEALSKDTLTEGSKLVVKWGQGEVACPKCGYQGSPRNITAEYRIDPVFPCPTCSAPVEIKSGTGYRILKVN